MIPIIFASVIYGSEFTFNLPKIDMALVLLAYFSVENYLTWKDIVYSKGISTPKKGKQSKSLSSSFTMSTGHLLFGLAYIRDFLVVNFSMNSGSDIVYNQATQRLFYFASIALLLLTVYFKYYTFKNVPTADLHYPDYIKIEEKTWERTLFHPVYAQSLTLFIMTFMWRPSTGSITPIILYPMFWYASEYIQKNCKEIAEKINPKMRYKDL